MRGCDLLAVQRERRTVLETALGIGLMLASGRIAAAEDDPAKIAPQPGDQFVFFSGDKKGQVIKVEDLTVGGPQLVAYPVDPKTQMVRNGTRLNSVALVRLDPAKMSEQTKKNAADGIVAYSAVCTHQGCPVSMWKADTRTLFCACHASQFDPADAAQVVDGPAPRPLAILPLKVDGGVPVASGEFEGRVGFQ